MVVSSELIRRLRDETGAGILDCRKALTETAGNLDKAKLLLREWGKADLAARSKEAREGRVDAYIHHNGKVGVLLEVNCETDFVGNSQEFRDFLKNVSMHIAAAYPAPLYVKPEDVPADVIARERDLYKHQAEQEKKPAAVIDKIVEGRLQKFFGEVCLLKQAYVKDATGKTTVEDLLGDLATKVGENLVIRRFARFEVGR